MLTEVPFYFLRHGETDWNRDRRAQGQIDIPLNATGIAQAKAAAEVVRGLGLRTICASPLSRAYETARFASEASGVPITVIDELKECGLGADEGRAGGAWFGDWRAGTYCPDGAETYEGFLARALGGVNKALRFDGPLLIVAHGGVFWSIQHHARLGASVNAMNGQVFRHDPPRADFPWWNVEAVGS
ncbi:MAG: histidine phosphatase family protein [Parvibaculum sp.]|jgi:probable phosphoglycerate mutase|uniref:histidine phosphatase family protein n=1 Tax=Parvibaculum sp. TaxID=2024848 RepID=UPI00283F1402|nr:histidine phosphatase family protein [Parvibaculum sp.]MDR3499536.1 histidine phosphatase family protein [Parvibaculum sp.]